MYFHFFLCTHNHTDRSGSGCGLPQGVNFDDQYCIKKSIAVTIEDYQLIK